MSSRSPRTDPSSSLPSFSLSLSLPLSPSLFYEAVCVPIFGPRFYHRARQERASLLSPLLTNLSSPARADHAAPSPLQIPEDLVHAASLGLATSLTPDELERDLLYPDIERIREVSIKVAVTVVRRAQQLKIDRNDELRGLDDKQLEEYIRKKSYHPLIEVEEAQT